MAGEKRYFGTVMVNKLNKSTNGTASINLKIRLSYDMAEPEKKFDRKIYHDLWLTDAAAERTASVLKYVLGWNGSDIRELNTNNSLFYGKNIEVSTKEDVYEGKTKEKVAFINSLGGQVGKKVDDQTADDIADIWNNIIASPGVQTTSGEPPHTDEDSF